MHNINKANKKANKCKICGKEISFNRILCSNIQCSVQYKKIQRESKWENDGGFGDMLNMRTPREYLISKRGRKCEICGTEKWMDKDVPLLVDHINGDSSDNTFKNLRIICPNCDAQLPTYKAKNKGNGRRTILRREKNKEFRESFC